MGEVKRKIANGAHNGSGGKGEKGEITLTAAEVVKEQKANGAHSGDGGKRGKGGATLTAAAVVSGKTAEQPSRRWRWEMRKRAAKAIKRKRSKYIFTYKIIDFQRIVYSLDFYSINCYNFKANYL